MFDSFFIFLYIFGLFLVFVRSNICILNCIIKFAFYERLTSKLLSWKKEACEE